jgi:hypothetical protein
MEKEVDISTIKKYEVVKWFDRRHRCILYGVDVIFQDGASLHVCEGDGDDLIFPNRKDAAALVKKYNQALTNPHTI